jgi:hypothetical protein
MARTWSGDRFWSDPSHKVPLKASLTGVPTKSDTRRTGLSCGRVRSAALGVYVELTRLKLMYASYVFSTMGMPYVFGVSVVNQACRTSISSGHRPLTSVVSMITWQ